MKPTDILDEFARAEAFAVRLMRAHRGDPRKPEFIEARVRIEQALVLLKDFRTAELKFRRDRRRIDYGSVRLRVAGEAFYYFAFRAYKALATCGVKFKPVGVIRARNHMMEHPGGRNGILVMNYTTDCPEGLILQPFGSRGQRDPGLYPNAEEYIELLIPKLNEAVAYAESRI